VTIDGALSCGSAIRAAAAAKSDRLEILIILILVELRLSIISSMLPL